MTSDAQSIADEGWGPFEVVGNRFEGPIDGEFDVHQGRYRLSGRGHLLEHWEHRLEKARRRMDREGEALRRRVDRSGLFSKISEWRLDPTEGWRLEVTWKRVGQGWFEEDAFPHDEYYDHGKMRNVTELHGPMPAVEGWVDLPEGFHYGRGRASVRLVHDGDETHWFGERCDGEGFPMHQVQGTLRRVFREIRNDNYDNWMNV